MGGANQILFGKHPVFLGHVYGSPHLQHISYALILARLSLHLVGTGILVVPFAQFYSYQRFQQEVIGIYHQMDLLIHLLDQVATISLQCYNPHFIFGTYT